jgi:hypothetical protein
MMKSIWWNKERKTVTMRMMTPTMMIKFIAKTMIQNTASYSQSSTLQTFTVYNTHFNIILQYVLLISQAVSYCEIFQLNVLCTNHPNHFICHFTWRIIITVFFAGYYKVLTHNMKMKYNNSLCYRHEQCNI